jgi:hypothetical protein
MNEERRKKLQDRLAWLEASMAGLERNFKRSPRFVALMGLVVPAWYFGGGLLAFYVAFMTGVFIGVWIYVAWSHLHENEVEIRSVRAELRRLESTGETCSRGPNG